MHRSQRRPRTIGEVRDALRPELPARFFSRNPARAAKLLVAFGSLTVHILVTAHASGIPLFPVVYAVSLLASANGLAFAFFYFHEAQHGAVFADTGVRFFSSLFAGTPFLLTPAGWRSWHTHHHRHTSMRADLDRPRHPAFDDVEHPTERVHAYLKHMHWRKPSTWMVMVFAIASSHAHAIITNLAGNNVIGLHRRRALVEYAAVLTLWCTPLAVLPLDVALAGYLAPVLLANMIASMYVISNHCGSALTERNYPLVNTRSVYILPHHEWSHMHFGRHVEHHLFPSVTHDKLAVVTRLLREKFPGEFEECSLPQTLRSIVTREQPFPPLVR